MLCECLLCVRETRVPPTAEPVLVMLVSLMGVLVGAGVKAGPVG